MTNKDDKVSDRAKEEQVIQEIVVIISTQLYNYEKAVALYDAGYRKLPDVLPVLSDEELLGITLDGWFAGGQYEVVKRKVAQAEADLIKRFLNDRT